MDISSQHSDLELQAHSLHPTLLISTFKERHVRKIGFYIYIYMYIYIFFLRYETEHLFSFGKCDSMDYTVHGILQGRILEWVAFPFSRGFS